MTTTPVKASEVALEFVEQSAAALRYLLCPAALDPARWTVLERRRFALPCGAPAWTLDVAIIGGSHALTLHAGDEALTAIDWRLGPDGVAIETWHSYPGDGVIAATATTIVLA